MCRSCSDGCLMVFPDTIMSRMYNQTGNLYKGVFDCLYKTITKEGVLALYKGYFAHLARILPHTVCAYPNADFGFYVLTQRSSVVDLDSEFGRTDQQIDAQSRRPNPSRFYQGKDMIRKTPVVC